MKCGSRCCGIVILEDIANALNQGETPKYGARLAG
jgi:hypothetical protein